MNRSQRRFHAAIWTVLLPLLLMVLVLAVAWRRTAQAQADPTADAFNNPRAGEPQP